MEIARPDDDKHGEKLVAPLEPGSETYLDSLPVMDHSFVVGWRMVVKLQWNVSSWIRKRLIHHVQLDTWFGGYYVDNYIHMWLSASCCFSVL